MESLQALNIQTIQSLIKSLKYVKEIFYSVAETSFDLLKDYNKKGQIMSYVSIVFI